MDEMDAIVIIAMGIAVAYSALIAVLLTVGLA